MSIDKKYQPIIDATKAGGEVLKKYFNQNIDIVKEKFDASDLQTTADLDSEKAILEILNKHYPDYNIISEEVGEIDRGSDFTFIIDPLDGTNNFSIGIPYFSSVVVLTKGDDAIFAVVINPITNDIYCAQDGMGAYKNNQKISVNSEPDVHRATVAHHVDYETTSEDKAKVRGPLGKLGIKRLLSSWSPALDMCLLASGRIEVIIRNCGVVHDFVAGRLICQESGAKITNLQGGPTRSDQINEFVITNGTEIHDEIIKITKELS